MEQDNSQGDEPPFYAVLVPNLGLGQHRHDILMKFYNLMKEHENDLARIIVSPCVSIVEACNGCMFTFWDTDPREWQDTGRCKGEYQQTLSVILHTMVIIRAKMHTVPPSSR